MGKTSPEEQIVTLQIKLKHLQNDFELTREEYETASRRYLEIMLELREKNEQLLDLQKNLENLVAERTSQLEQTQKVLQQKSEELQTMIDCSPAMIFYMDFERRFVRINRAFAEFVGKPIKEIIGGTDEELFEGSQNGFHTDDDIVIASGRPVLDLTVIFNTSKGERELLMHKLPFHDDTGKTVGVIGFALDVTEQRQLEYERAKVYKLESLGVLAGGIAHDFNNILTAILGNISLSQSLVDRDDEIFRRLNSAENACLKAKDLTQQLLTFAQGGAPVKKTTSLRELIKEITWFALSGSNVRAYFAIAENLWNVDVDEEQIVQVINNLALNAIQAMPDGGVISVGAENVNLARGNPISIAPGKYIKITIKDSGHGISQEDLPRIFDPFFTTRQSSSGMGSTTAWSIVKRHGGHIAAQSSPGSGSMFDIYLPSSETLSPEQAGVSDKNIPSSLKILVMDDDKMVCDIAEHILSHLGHQAAFAADGEEALPFYSQAEKKGDPFDLVILDLTIPGGMGGKQAVTRLRKMNPQVKTLVSSGYSNDPVLSEFSQYGFDGVVTKPFNVESLRQSVELVYAHR